MFVVIISSKRCSFFFFNRTKKIVKNENSRKSMEWFSNFRREFKKDWFAIKVVCISKYGFKGLQQAIRSVFNFLWLVYYSQIDTVVYGVLCKALVSFSAQVLKYYFLWNWIIVYLRKCVLVEVCSRRKLQSVQVKWKSLVLVPSNLRQFLTYFDHLTCTDRSFIRITSM